MSPSVLMWVQSRLGLGHLARALTLCGALAENGFAVTLAHGGPPATALAIPPGVRLVQLPVAIAPDLNSSAISDAEGHPIDETWREKRIVALKALIDDVSPDIFITETFPLGRWLFDFELSPVLDWLHLRPKRPRIVASVRDVLTQPSKAKKSAAMIDTARRRYDLVMCHGDPRILTLPESFPETSALAAMTRYTGYVTGPVSSSAATRRGVIVAAGGGAVGGALFEAALGARRLWTRETETWTLVAGPRYDAAGLDRLRGSAPEGLEILGAVEGLARRYADCALVVGQAGYNSVCEALSHGARLTVVPYATGKETEQTIRTEKFARLGFLTSVAEAALSPRTLVAAMETALDAPPPAISISFGGGGEAARMLRGLMRETSH